MGPCPWDAMHFPGSIVDCRAGILHWHPVTGEFVPKLVTLWKAGIGRKQLRRDLVAGVVVGIVALPLAVAFGIASGVTPEKGLVTAIVAGFVISAINSSSGMLFAEYLLKL